jgi:GDP-L-fucose synthase
VDDVISVVEWFIENQPKYNHYNVCRGEHIDLYELAEIIKEELTYGENIVVKEPGWKREYSGDNSRLIREMGEIRFTPYRQIVRELITYYSSLIDTIDETVL